MSYDVPRELEDVIWRDVLGKDPAARAWFARDCADHYIVILRGLFVADDISLEDFEQGIAAALRGDVPYMPPYKRALYLGS